MKAFVFRSIGIAALCISSLALMSCGNDQRLVSIVVTPQDVTITGVDFTDAPSIIQFQSSAAGLLAPTGNGAGTNLGVTATVYSNSSNPSAGTLVFGTAVITVN